MSYFSGNLRPNLDSKSGSDLFYKEKKPFLLEEGFYSLLDAETKEPFSYFVFQNRLQELVPMKDGLSLALSSMVEVNVAGGILLKSVSSRGSGLLNQITNSNYIVATGVSEPKWEGQLKNLKSQLDADFHLTGVKSFVTNGTSADTVLWVLPYQNKYSIFAVDIHSDSKTMEKETITTPFASLASHLKISLTDFPISPADLVLEDYGKLGIELRLKELFSLVSLLLGLVQKEFSFEIPGNIRKEWESLSVWRDVISKQLTNENFLEVLESCFPFPISSLLDVLKEHYRLDSVSDLSQIHPDYSLFIWEDGFTKYLMKKKNRNA